MPPTLALAAALAFGAVPLPYEAPPGAGTPKPDATRLLVIEAGQKLFAAYERAPMREAPTPDGKVLRLLPLAFPVEVRNLEGGQVLVDGRVGRWVRVIALERGTRVEGYVFDDALTPLAGRVDLDGDGKEEAWAASWTKAFAARLQVSNEALLEPERLDALELPLPQGAKRGGELTLFDVPPLGPRKRSALGLRVCKGLACSASVVAYDVDDGGGVLAPLLTSTTGVAGPALSLEGDVLKLERAEALVGAWPMVTCPGCGDGGLTVVWHAPRAAFTFATGNEESESEQSRVSCATVGGVVNGPWAGFPVVGCRVEAPQRTFTAEPFASHVFVRTKKGLLRIASAGSKHDPDLGAALKERGEKVGLDEKAVLLGASLPEKALVTPAGAVVAWGLDTEPAKGRVLFVHREAGPVLVDEKTGALSTPRPDGTTRRWTLSLPLPREVGERYTLERDPGCGPGSPGYRPFVVAPVKREDTTQKGAVVTYKGKALEDRLVALRAEALDSRFGPPMSQAAVGQLLRAAPLTAMRDPFDRVVELTPLGFKRECTLTPGGEPEDEAE